MVSGARMDFEQYVVSFDATIEDALKKIEANKTGTVFLIDLDGHVFGALTDGDIRRGLIDGINLDDNITSCTNSDFVWASVDSPREQLIKLLDNIFYVPQILHLFPRAKIIYLSRDRKDTAWSIFENFFTSRWMVYANSIEKIERHLNAVEEASNLWQKMAYQNYLTINYNDLATQTTETLNMLSEFLGSAVKNKKVVGQVTYTGSASQVHSEVKFQTGKWANLHEFFDKNFKTTWDRL